MKKILFLLGIIVLSDSCVERADFSAKEALAQLVVEGLVTDEPGPYTVKLSRARKPLDFSATVTVSAFRVTISDDAGNSEVLTEVVPGTYQTSVNGIRGVVGRSYVLKIETRDGKVYESIPDKLSAGGSIDQLYASFETKVQDNGTPQYRFKVFLDATTSSSNFYRWKFSAFYRVLTFPEQRRVQAGEGTIAAPRPCSGYIFTGGQLEQVGPCTCCTCWPKLVDVNPIISTSQVPTNGKFQGVEVGTVPLDYWLFFDKTMIEVKQLNISETASRFWKTVEDQKDGGTSLFQPAIGQAGGNILQKNGNDQVLGLFYAAGVATSRIFIDKSNIPNTVPLPEAPPAIPESCILAFTNSSNQEPIGWQ
ncbi:MAG: DUF4249 domain-containing protein [Bacteroidota bacterium]